MSLSTVSFVRASKIFKMLLDTNIVWDIICNCKTVKFKTIKNNMIRECTCDMCMYVSKCIELNLPQILFLGELKLSIVSCLVSIFS